LIAEALCVRSFLALLLFLHPEGIELIVCKALHNELKQKYIVSACGSRRWEEFVSFSETSYVDIMQHTLLV
jgi:hypothetical protein